MTSPSETARDYQAVPEDNQNRPEPSWDPAGAPPAGDPQSAAPAASGYPGITAVDSAPAEPGLAEGDDAEAPFAFSRPPAAEPELAPETPFAFSRPPAAEPELAPETPFAFSRPPAAEPAPALPAPVARDSASPSTRWQGIQAMFVDDPHSSLQLAAGLVGDSAEALVVSVKEHQHSLLAAWQGEEAGTEELRTTLQQYRTFWNRLEDFSREA
jgi:hypothetical protein